MNTLLKLTLTASLTSISITALSTTALAAPVINYGENLTKLKQAYRQGQVHFLQVGDSHTAGDYFTEQLRKRLQAEVGDGGLGFAYAMPVRGQRTARHGYDNFGWQLSSSKHERWVDYPLGGIVGSPSSNYAELHLTSQYYAGDRQNMRMIVKGRAGESVKVSDITGQKSLPLTKNGWQVIDTVINFPAKIQASPDMSVGGFWLSRSGGGRVSSMGINGATQEYWRRWRSGIEQDLQISGADLVILAYGTNEAFQDDVSDQIGNLTYAIKKIRQGLPNTPILLVNAPDSLKSTAGGCGVRAPNLSTVQLQIQQVARQQHTLYWSWQDAMGGNCSMKGWIRKGLGRSDGVHFTRAGYEAAANDLYENLKTTLNLKGDSFAPYTAIKNTRGAVYNDNFSNNSSTNVNTQIKRIYSAVDGDGNYRLQNTPNNDRGNVTYRYRNSDNNSHSHQGRGSICNSDGQCRHF